MYALIVYALVGTSGSVHIQTIKVSDCSILPRVQETLKEIVNKNPSVEGWKAICLDPDLTV